MTIRSQPSARSFSLRKRELLCVCLAILLSAGFEKVGSSRGVEGPVSAGTQSPIILVAQVGQTTADPTLRAGKSSLDLPKTGDSPPLPATLNQQERLDPNAYIIGEQDTLNITVWKEKEISGTVVVRPDGKITVPLVGEISVVGMTPAHLQALLTDKLKPFVTIPQVTVAVADIRSRKVYLIGHAAREGPFMINSSTTVLQVIAEAGGLRDFAKRKKIYILRQEGNAQVRFPFNYDDVIKGKNIDQNILLQPGDTVVVP